MYLCTSKDNFIFSHMYFFQKQKIITTVQKYTLVHFQLSISILFSINNTKYIWILILILHDLNTMRKNHKTFIYIYFYI